MTLLSTRPTRFVSAAAEDAELLFKEAHQRRRRRRIVMGAVAAAALAATTAAVAFTGSGSGHAQAPASAPVVSRPTITKPSPPPQVAWVDYQGRVHIGSLQTHQHRVIASGGGDATTSLVVSGRTLFWASGGGLVYEKATGRLRSFAKGVMAYDRLTGRVRLFENGEQVFNAIDSTDVFVGSADAQHLARYSADGRLIERLALPDGWYLADAGLLGNPGPALAHGGILVRSQRTIQAETVGAGLSKLAVWTPQTGSIRRLGDVWQVVGTYTDDRGAKSLVAWLPADCWTTTSCSLQVTDPATGATRQIRNPLGLGFDFGGAFSPDGRQLAAFAMTNPGNYNPETRLALIDVATGSLQLVSGATINIGDSLAWAQWLPGSRQLIVGGTSDNGGLSQANHFLVDSASSRSTPFRFLADGSQDVNYSVVVLP